MPAPTPEDYRYLRNLAAYTWKTITDEVGRLGTLLDDRLNRTDKRIDAIAAAPPPAAKPNLLITSKGVVNLATMHQYRSVADDAGEVVGGEFLIHGDANNRPLRLNDLDECRRVFAFLQSVAAVDATDPAMPMAARLPEPVEVVVAFVQPPPEPEPKLKPLPADVVMPAPRPVA